MPLESIVDPARWPIDGFVDVSCAPPVVAITLYHFITNHFTKTWCYILDYSVEVSSSVAAAAVAAAVPISLNPCGSLSSNGVAALDA